MRRLLFALTGTIAMAINASRVAAGLIVVSGDDTPAFRLTDDFPDSATPGNQRFFSNVLGTGKQVAVLNESYSDFAPGEVNTYYDSLSGVSSSLLTGSITPASLSGVDLLVVAFPKKSFSASEIQAVSGFLGRGGSLFLLGEAQVITNGTTANANINNLLAGLGSGLSIVNATYDIGTQVATGAQIANDPLTSGVAAFNYGATASVDGGTRLFSTSGGQTFVTYERTVSAVPEPSSTAAFVGGTLSLLVARRFRRRHGG